jgi:hypothetical protein
MDASVSVNLDMDVNCALNIKPREHRLNFHNAVEGDGPHAAKLSGVTGVDIGIWSDGLVLGGDEFLKRSIRTIA